uniref:Cytosol aminopeptidase n=1 Tax=Cercocebus atys TaxID=9531 RepID=A0A2K5P764_CERAT
AGCFGSWGLSAADMTKGLVLGIYSQEKEDGVPPFTSAGENFDKLIAGKLRGTLNISGPPLKDFPSVVLVGLSIKAGRIDKQGNWREGKENIRAALAAGYLELSSVEVDPCGDAQAAEEGAVLGLYEYDDLKQKKKMAMSVKLYGRVLFACGQNLARHLMETQANEMMPTRFAEIIEKNLKSANSKTEVHIRRRSWIEEQAMGPFLSVAKGSDEPPVFLEIHYKGSLNANEPPLVFVGKGITFDSGGISIKASANMDLMRADMGGAATICSGIVSAAKLNLPINITGLAPLCENMPSSKVNKLGDVVRARNGKTIQVDNTDAEGRLILADALSLVSGATGVFTNLSWLWNKLFEASIETGDCVWRMPLFKHYTRQIVDCQLADVNNIGKYRSAGACTAAAFLKEFVTHPKWAHLDTAGMMTNKDEVPYLRKGMTGSFSQDNA